jgi:Zn-dependent peptidase ImmA (M78 family)/DNA-binding XRE family transcriptional regulator
MRIKVNPEMFRLARESRGYTQSELAKETGINQGNISRLELGSAEISDDKLGIAAEKLKYPLSFFFQDERYTGLGVSIVFYRKRASTLISHMRRLEAEANVRRIQAKALLRDASLTTPNEFRAIDVAALDGNASTVAQMTRANWRIPPGPVKNLIAVIESAGGVVFRFPFGTRDVDALSQWPDDSPPLFFVNSEADADRMRFSLAHELGHMVMHDQVSETMEDEANHFAAEFLMPEKDIRHELYGMSIERASALKPYWRVSMAAILKRAYDLGCMTQYRYSSVFTYLSRLGFKRKEPNPIPQEEPRLVRKLIDAHVQQNGFTRADFSRLLHLVEDEVDEKYLKPAGGLRLAL